MTQEPKKGDFKELNSKQFPMFPLQACAFAEDSVGVHPSFAPVGIFVGAACIGGLVVPTAEPSSH